ncbi:MAG: hypothetical protein NVS3B26_01280 [Mycobacteriales bacterium]
MPRRPPLILAATALTLAGCTSHPAAHAQSQAPVAVPVPTAAAPLVLSSCRALTATLPEQLVPGTHRRPVTGDPGRTAAWGDPPITLQCGVPLPDQRVTPVTIDNLPLVTDERGQQVSYTTQDRAVNATVAVPKSYQDQAYLVLPLIAALKKLPLPKGAPGA